MTILSFEETLTKVDGFEIHEVQPSEQFASELHAMALTLSFEECPICGPDSGTAKLSFEWRYDDESENAILDIHWVCENGHSVRLQKD